ncbi:MAG: fumarylacetoacetate hydrolase family protein [Actinobacteria bacterium]|nr:fumarylacetoacetate hydrolase family protein [Actinomycetota bacterium]
MSGFGVFSRDGARRLCRRDGDEVVELRGYSSLDEVFGLGRAQWEELLHADGPRHATRDVTLELPFTVADFVDFYASLEHATAMGRHFRPDDEPLFPNWRRVPVGYHGRAGTVVVSGTGIERPCGQLSEAEFGPTRQLDVEVELGYVVAADSPVFEDAVFGVVVVNDWSARDIQAFESRPLGPFLGKSFATSVSAWVTPLAVLEEAWVEPPRQEPEPAPHLRGGRALAAELELERNGTVVSRPDTRTLYWTGPQLLAHLRSNGTRLRPGDLLATGTISAPEPGSLLELGAPFLEDGEEVVIRGRAGPVELGEVRGRIYAPAR